MREYDLEHYDDDEQDDSENVEDREGTGMGRARTMDMFGNIRSLAYYESNKDDPYITLEGPDDELEDEDREDLQILATDNLIIASKVEDDVAHLEVYVYEDASDNLYVHHDIMLPAIPLCVEWLDYAVQGQGGTTDNSSANFVAIGTMDPEIEVWDLDVVDCLYPSAILGGGGGGSEAQLEEGSADQQKKKKKKRKEKRRKKTSNDEYHVDAVLALAGNRKHRNLLASGSADKTVKLWDLSTGRCAKSYDYHADKVCSLAWHGTEATVMLSGSYDRTVVACDMRAPGAAAPRWTVESDVEVVRWDPHDDNKFLVATEAGLVYCHDLRAAGTGAVWTLQAHDEAVTALDVNAIVPGFLATGSTDRTVKLWSVQAGEGGGPTLVVSRNPDVGKVFSTTFGRDNDVAFRLAVAGSKGTLRVWDTSTNAGIRKAFAHRIAANGAAEEHERLIGVDEGEDDSSSGEEADGGVGVSEGESMDED